MKDLWHQQMIRVHYQDTDQMSVAHHANYVTWFEISRTEMMRDTGVTYRDMEERGLLLPVIDLNIKYRSPARYDDHLAVFTKVVKISPVRLDFNYEVRRIEEKVPFKTKNNEPIAPHGTLLATASSSHMWINTDWKITRLDKAHPDVYKILKDRQ